MSVYIIYTYVHIHYIHCIYIEDINTCTFVQSYKPINRYTHNVLRGARGCTCGHATLVGGTEPCVQRPIPTLSQLRTHTKVNTFSEPHNLVGNGSGTSMGSSAQPVQTFPGSEGHWPPEIKWVWEDDTFHDLGSEKSWNGTYSPTARQAISTGKEAILPDFNLTRSYTELGSTAKGCLSSRDWQGVRLLCWERPKGPGYGFPKIKAQGTGRALLILGSLPWPSSK